MWRLYVDDNGINAYYLLSDICREENVGRVSQTAPVLDGDTADMGRHSGWRRFGLRSSRRTGNVSM